MWQPAWKSWKKGGRPKSALRREASAPEGAGSAPRAVAGGVGGSAPDARVGVGGGGDPVGQLGGRRGCRDQCGGRGALRCLGCQAAGRRQRAAADGDRTGVSAAFLAGDGQPAAAVDPVL